MTLNITTRPVTPSRFKDLETIFNARGCSIARGCWCMYYRRSGSQSLPEGKSRAVANHDALKEMVDTGPHRA